MTPAGKVTGGATAQDLFALTDEQILDIAPENEVAGGDSRGAVQEGSATNSQATATATAAAKAHSSVSHEAPSNSHVPQLAVAVLQEPPAWLAAQMKDPWGGEEAREFWDGVQQARSEAAAYRAAIATPDDARALKELYPGGVAEARAAAERGRLLEDIDRAYFGAAGSSPEQTSASRAQLAQRMMREDPAAFREMVAAGLHALQEAEQGSGAAANAATVPRLAQVLTTSRSDAGPTLDATPANSGVGAQHVAPQLGNTLAAEAHVAAYAAFERAVNEDLERSVGGAIERTLAQALPVAQPLMAVHAGAEVGARTPAIRERLTASVRSEVEKALQGDRQLGEQVAQILSSRRFDNDARAQVVRLVGERAQQLVPGAAKRVLNEWTQTTLAAHRGRTQRTDAASERTDVALASVPARPAGGPARPAVEQSLPRRLEASATKASRSVNYRKLSDEQILDL